MATVDVASAEQRAREAIRHAGYFVQRIERILPPWDSGQPMEVLFIGRRVGRVGERAEPTEPLTAYVHDRDDAEAIVCSGW